MNIHTSYLNLNGLMNYTDVNVRYIVLQKRMTCLDFFKTFFFQDS